MRRGPPDLPFRLIPAGLGPYTTWRIGTNHQQWLAQATWSVQATADSHPVSARGIGSTPACSWAWQQNKSKGKTNEGRQRQRAARHNAATAKAKQKAHRAGGLDA